MDATYTGQQIAQCRKALGLTQKSLVQQLHVTDKAVSKWERGLNFPNLGLMEDLAAAPDTTPAQLLGLEEAPQTEVIRSMAALSAGQLESFCTHALAEAITVDSRKYGPWVVTFYPQAGMLEFHTDGHGLVPSAVYEGFYYSARNTHMPYQNVQVPLKDWGDYASWTDGTDNSGTSQRFRENWFWFEASF